MKTINTLKKVSLATFLTFVLSFSSVFAQNDTMYIMKSGAIAGQYNVNTEVGSVISYKPTLEGSITYGSITDIDGNTYKTVTIGTQTWMAENLKVTKYNDGIAIPNVTDNTAWWLPTGALCDYDNTPSNSETYGKLYNWDAVNTGKLCPTGWHVPNDDDWNTLENYLIANGYNYDGTTTDNKIAKALASPDGWPSATVEGSIGNNDYPHKQNVSGFSALPGGYRFAPSGTYDAIGTRGFWWSATETAETKANGRRMYNDYIHLRTLDSGKSLGWSVRCVRD